jgi:hypothetical protein
MINFQQHHSCAKFSSLLLVVILSVSLISFHRPNTCMASAQSETPSSGGHASAGSSPSVVEDQRTNDATTTTTTTTNSAATDSFNVKEHLDWGSYYDPKNIFCGRYDCYRILGFDYESFGAQKPDTKLITKRYRALSREWHPDKSKHKNAEERFVVSQRNMLCCVMLSCFFFS